MHALCTASQAALTVEVGPRKILIDATLTVGKYLVSPLTRLTDGGRYAASVSIRSGRGSATHDRVLRLVPTFTTAAEAACYAIRQALAWIGSPATPRLATSSSSTNQD